MASDTAGPETGKESQPPLHPEPFWLSFQRGDIKLLLLTFAGTVAANVATVLVVAVSIGIDRGFISAGGVRLAEHALDVMTGLLVLYALAALNVYRRVRNRFSRARLRNYKVIVSALLGFSLILLLILWLGLAVGVK